MPRAVFSVMYPLIWEENKIQECFREAPVLSEAEAVEPGSQRTAQRPALTARPRASRAAPPCVEGKNNKKIKNPWTSEVGSF